MALPNWWDAVKSAMRSQGVPVEVWLPILLAESTGDPTAHNTGTPQVPEDSVGLFQLNRRGGQGAGYTVEQLMNPAINAEVASRYIAEGMRVCQAQGDGSIQCVAVNSGHPGRVPVSDKRVTWIAQLWEAIKQGASDADRWVKGTAQAGVGPTDGGTDTPAPGGGWLPSFPSGEDIGAGIAKGFWSGLLFGPATRAFAAKLGYHDASDIAWALTFGGVGLALSWAGIQGLANASGVTSGVAKVVAMTVPNPAVRAGAMSVDALTPDAPALPPVLGQGATRPT